MLVSDNSSNAQRMLSNIEISAPRVGLLINLSLTEFLLVGSWNSLIQIKLSPGFIKQVSDFKYLGSWLMDCSKDYGEPLPGKRVST